MKTATLVLSAVCIVGMVSAAHAAGDAAAGKAKATASCAGCHGANGEGMGPNPKLAGKSADAIAKAIAEYRDGTRPNPTKKALLSPLTDKEIADLAAYYAGL
jgi:cytochrome c553